MAAAYSMDLRTRVLRDSDAGLSSKELAERYHVSRAWVDALKQRRRETGSFAPRKQTTFRQRALAATDMDRLAALVIAARRTRRSRAPRRAADVGRSDDHLARPYQLDFTLKKNGTRRRTTATRRRR